MLGDRRRLGIYSSRQRILGLNCPCHCSARVVSQDDRAQIAGLDLGGRSGSDPGRRLPSLAGWLWRSSIRRDRKTGTSADDCATPHSPPSGRSHLDRDGSPCLAAQGSSLDSGFSSRGSDHVRPLGTSQPGFCSLVLNDSPCRAAQVPLPDGGSQLGAPIRSRLGSSELR